MRFFLLLLAAVGLAASRATAQTTPGFERLPSGVEYQLFRRDATRRYQRYILTKADTAGYKSRVGKFLLGHMEMRTGRDSMLQSTRQLNGNQPLPLPLETLGHGTTIRDELTQVLALVQPGDSAEFRLHPTAKELAASSPAEIRRFGNVLLVRLVGLQLLTPAEARQLVAAQRKQRPARHAGETTTTTEAAADSVATTTTVPTRPAARRPANAQTALAKALARPGAPAQLKKDEAAILAYLKAKHLPAARRTLAGVYYLITRPGTGPVAHAGQVITMRYRGTLLTGQQFTAGGQTGEPPVYFVLGKGDIIPGWEQGLSQLNKGSRATLFIPSPLAYGKAGLPPGVPANAPLRVEVELLNIR
ncbi:MAG: FKBP-type peptidyl-prolyl cis-trans isomerase [Janthinobacterium lividum]